MHGGDGSEGSSPKEASNRRDDAAILPSGLPSGLRAALLAFAALACVVGGVGAFGQGAALQVIFPFRKELRFSPSWFGAIVLPPGRVTAQVHYAGDACEFLLGRVPVRDQIILVDRGRCSFLQKVKHGEQAGALAVILVNDSNDYFIMTDDGSGRQVRIHSFLISHSDGQLIKASLPCSQGVDPCNETSKGVTVSYGLGFQTYAHAETF